MFQIATWNVNSLKVREEQVFAWLLAHPVDVLALQETKMTDDVFPAAKFREHGFFVQYSGQKTYNGVAIVSRHPIEAVMTDIPGLDCPQRRILIATIRGIRVMNLYVPNGSEPDSPKYVYKMDWLEKVIAFLKQDMQVHRDYVVLGDFNIAPHDKDVHDPVVWQNSVLVSPKERAHFQSLLDAGLYDAFRCKKPDEIAYSWWDYRAGGFRRNNGLRIDHILLTPSLIEKLADVTMDIEPRRHERPSDHIPVVASLEC